MPLLAPNAHFLPDALSEVCDNWSQMAPVFLVRPAGRTELLVKVQRRPGKGNCYPISAGIHCVELGAQDEAGGILRLT